MTPSDELIDSITLHTANLEHIMKRGKINGGLRSDLKSMITKVRRESLQEAIIVIDNAPTIGMAQEKIKRLML